MHTRQQQKRHKCTEKAHKHVPLRIPGIALRPQELIGTLPQRHRRPELDKFITCTDGETTGQHEAEQDRTGTQPDLSDQYFAKYDGWNKALHDVTEAVVGVTAEPQPVLYGEPRRYARVSDRRRPA